MLTSAASPASNAPFFPAQQESKRHIMAWWWWSAACLLMSVFLFIWVAVYLAKSDHLVGIPIIVFASIVALSMLFLWIVKTYVNYVSIGVMCVLCMYVRV